MPLELPQVVVDLLSGQAQPWGEHGGRVGFHQLSQQPGPDRIERDLRRGRVLNHRHIEHAVIMAPTVMLGKTNAFVGLTCVADDGAGCLDPAR